MVKTFFTKELSFVLALISLVILYFSGSNPAIKESLLLEGAVFLLIFAVIIYAALGVVHHAELLAYKFGEPYGTMILTLSAVTVPAEFILPEEISVAYNTELVLRLDSPALIVLSSSMVNLPPYFSK